MLEVTVSSTTVVVALSIPRLVTLQVTVKLTMSVAVYKLEQLVPELPGMLRFLVLIKMVEAMVLVLF